MRPSIFQSRTLFPFCVSPLSRNASSSSSFAPSRILQIQWVVATVGFWCSTNSYLKGFYMAGWPEKRKDRGWKRYISRNKFPKLWHGNYDRAESFRDVQECVKRHAKRCVVVHGTWTILIASDPQVTPLATSSFNLCTLSPTISPLEL